MKKLIIIIVGLSNLITFSATYTYMKRYQISLKYIKELINQSVEIGYRACEKDISLEKILEAQQLYLNNLKID